MLGTITVALTGLVALELFGEVAGLIALVLAAVYPVLIELSVTLVAENLLTALVLTEVINRRAFGWEIGLHLRAAQFSQALLLALAAALAAALYPAWRSARMPLAAGLREE